MNRRLLTYIIAGVVFAHVAAFYFLTHSRPRRAVPRPAAAAPNFSAGGEVYTVTGSDEKVRYREYRVSTQLTAPEVVEQIKRERAAQSTPTP